MGWFSILPPEFAFIETWVARLFLLLGAISIGPWLLLIIYDALLYLFRTATYEIPIIGGRARNRPRPRAPSLTERPSGKLRRFSLTAPGALTSEDVEEETVKRRRIGKGHERSGSETIHEDE